MPHIPHSYLIDHSIGWEGMDWIRLAQDRDHDGPL
jgi:hypothetical protein